MTGNPLILVGDVGGTTTKLALLDEKLAFQEFRRYPSREHDSLNHIVGEFLGSRAQTVTHACFDRGARARGVGTDHKPALGGRGGRFGTSDRRD